MPSERAAIGAGWGRVVGQDRVKGFLRNALKTGRLAHAFLFSGPAGAGMDAAAIELARAALCETAGDEACGVCRHCRLTAGLQHPDLFLHFPLPVGRGEGADDDPLAKLTQQELERIRAETALKAENPYHQIVIPRANQLKINSVRSIRRHASLGSFESGRKVFLLFDAGKLTPEAANALLKTLEEPLPGTLLVLTTPDPDSLLPTVVSRCQHVRFDPLSEEEIAPALVARGIGGPKAATVAKLAAGSFTAALGLADEDLSARRNAAVELLRCFLHKDAPDVMEMIRGAADGERSELSATLILLQTWVRDAMLTGAGRPAEANADDTATLAKFVRQYPGFDYAAATEAIDRAVSDLRKNVYIHLVLHALRIGLLRAARAAAGANP